MVDFPTNHGAYTTTLYCAMQHFFLTFVKAIYATLHDAQ